MEPSFITVFDVRNTWKGPFRLLDFQRVHRHIVPIRFPSRTRKRLLHMLMYVVQLKGQEHEEEIKPTLTQLVSDLEGYPTRPKLLASSTICVAQNTQNSQRHYGVPVSATPATRRILIAASCLSTLDKYVAGAVMTYHPDNKKMPHFDGTLQLPSHVRESEQPAEKGRRRQNGNPSYTQRSNTRWPGSGSLAS
ncbi:hypothetical protein Q5P01_004430 [Channa striata]|uniref:Uncharacterized protein n=1 Tax=Channa striata TaxID=64152 RepID=A0AA88NNN1_CHASR|nr:hypothetical protein Q5P01_004430 [Channa striata]